MNRTSRIVAAAAAGTLILGTASISATAAPAAPPLKVRYDASGTSYTPRNDSTLTLYPTTLTSRLRSDGSFTGSLPLKPTTSTFKAFGILPTSATVTFVPTAPVRGQLTNQGTQVQATATYLLRLSDVTIGSHGHTYDVGSSCQTIDPVAIPVSTPPGQQFSITSGGTVTGVYTIGNFANCRGLEHIINKLVPGSGNTTTLNLTNGRVLP